VLFFEVKMHQTRKPGGGFAIASIYLCLPGCGIAVSGSEAQAQGSCEQIRATCESAG
jgi:hypothetical protein